LRHQPAQAIYERILDGQYDTPFLLDYVFDELVTLVQVRTKRNDLATLIGDLVLDQLGDLFVLVQVSSTVFRSAWSLFSNQTSDKLLSFTDCAILAVSKEYEIDHVASVDTQMKSFHSVIDK